MEKTLFVCLFVMASILISCEKDEGNTDGTPKVETIEVKDINPFGASISGKVSGGSYDVTYRGVCVGLSNNPTINNSYIQSGQGLGEFVSTFGKNNRPLAINTVYFARAYAGIKTDEGTTTIYGNEISFKTTDGIATISKGEITEVTANSFIYNGSVLNDGMLEVTARGFCWGITNEPKPTYYNYISCGQGVGDFSGNTKQIGEMHYPKPNTKYFVRAYATNYAGTVYGEEIMVTTLAE